MELQTGGNAATMSLELYSKEDTLIGKLDNDDALLGSYAVDNGMRLHVSQIIVCVFTVQGYYTNLDIFAC